MPTKKRTQKQKQKQKQTVIVNINEKPKTRRKRTTKKAPPAKRTGESSHIPLNAVRDILFQLSRGTHAPNAIIDRVMAIRNQDPQAEIIRDVLDENRIPNRPPTSLTPIDTASGILRGNTPQPSPFVSSIPRRPPSILDVAEEYNTYTQLPMDDRHLVDEYVLGVNAPPPPSIFATTEEYGTYANLPTNDRHLVDEYILEGNAPPPSPIVNTSFSILDGNPPTPPSPFVEQPPSLPFVEQPLPSPFVEPVPETTTTLTTDDQGLLDEYVGGNAQQPPSILDGNPPTPPSPFVYPTLETNIEPIPSLPVVDLVPVPTDEQGLLDEYVGGNAQQPPSIFDTGLGILDGNPPTPSLPFVEQPPPLPFVEPEILPSPAVEPTPPSIFDTGLGILDGNPPTPPSPFVEPVPETTTKPFVEPVLETTTKPPPLVLKVDANTEIKNAGFKGAKNIREAINVWNKELSSRGQPAEMHILTTHPEGGYKNNTELLAEIIKKDMTPVALKEYHDHYLANP